MELLNVSRRDFLRTASIASAGLVIGVRAFGETSATPSPAPSALGAFVEIGRDGLVTIYVSKSDMGQGLRTSLPMIVAEELDADWSNVRVRQADADKKYGRMGTGGSGSIRTMWTPLRNAGAAARAMLVAAAAAKWGVDKGEITVSNGVIAHGDKKLGFGDVAEAASKLEIPKEILLKDPAKFTIIGKKTDRLDNRDLVAGRSHYGIDTRVPGMLYAAVLRAPVFGGKVASVDDGKAKAIDGVKHVVRVEASDTNLPWNGVAVVATSTWAAMRGRDALAVTWDAGDAKSETTASLAKEMSALLQSEGKRYRNDGDVDAALSAAATKLEATYSVPFLAHATMEPMNATAHVRADGAELWLPTQFPDWATGAVAKALGMKVSQVTTHVTLLGGGFGRRANPDFALEAALISKAVNAPVKVQWTREDDMQHDFYRPASVHHIAAGLDAAGKLTAWHHRASSPAIGSYYGNDDPGDAEMRGISDMPFEVPHMRVEHALAHSAVPRGWWRSVENSGNAFVAASFLDEAAHAAGKDPIEYQLAMLTAGRKVAEMEPETKPFPFEADRLRGVIELVRAKSDWTSDSSKLAAAGRARGFAAWWSFLSYVAEVVEVSVEGGVARVHRVVAAIDCGTPVNPDGIAAQVEGGIVYGLSAALYGEITIDGGAVQQSNFHDYPLLTIADMPQVEVHIVPSTAAPTGTGEPGLPPIAPAVANALFRLTGKRVRSLPIKQS
jgi:isoquinoline 1-oxidoreductase beta subunit